MRPINAVYVVFIIWKQKIKIEFIELFLKLDTLFNITYTYFRSFFQNTFLHRSIIYNPVTIIPQNII